MKFWDWFASVWKKIIDVIMGLRKPPDEPPVEPEEPPVVEPPAEEPPTEPEPPEEDKYSDVQLLARIAWWESRGESAECSLGVMNVVLNRVGKKWWAKTIRGVIEQPSQFTPFENPNFYVQDITQDVNYDLAALAVRALAGETPLPSRDYYYCQASYRGVKDYEQDPITIDETIFARDIGDPPLNPPAPPPATDKYPIREYLMTNNDSYKVARVREKTYIIVHSTACPGVVCYPRFSGGYYPNGTLNLGWNQPGEEKSVNYFIDAGDIGITHSMPDMWQTWNAGGLCNDNAISIELGEPSDYANAAFMADIWDKLVWLCARLCKQYNIPAANIISHKEAAAKGWASDHGDPDHWWNVVSPKRTMDQLRAAVSEAIK